LLKNEEINLEIQRLNASISAKTGISVVSVIEDLKHLAQIAEEKGKYGMAIRCLQLLGEHIGLFK
jgi:hypothetical protein